MLEPSPSSRKAYQCAWPLVMVTVPSAGDVAESGPFPAAKEGVTARTINKSALSTVNVSFRETVNIRKPFYTEN